MAIKRKRSDSEISRSGSLLSSPPSNMMAIDSFQFPDHQIHTPSLFSSRTRKRHRDNRPSEEDVHQHTLSLLFSAQQGSQSHTSQFQPAPVQPPIPAPTGAVLSTSFRRNHQQSSLHSFWPIPNARETSPSSNASNSSAGTPTAVSMSSFFSATNCEDCDAPLDTEDSQVMDADMMMDIDNTGGSHYGCTRCGKPVCSRCSVSNLGAERKCLLCAGRQNRWISGVSWMDQD